MGFPIQDFEGIMRILRDAASQAEQDPDADCNGVVLADAVLPGGICKTSNLWTGGYGSQLFGILFAPPDAPGIGLQVVQCIERWHYRSGEFFHFFVPGYSGYISSGACDEQNVSGTRFWRFSQYAFEQFRQQLQQASNNRWRYKGNCEMVVFEATLKPPPAEPIVHYDKFLRIDLRNVPQAYGDFSGLMEYWFGQLERVCNNRTRPLNALKRKRAIRVGMDVILASLAAITGLVIEQLKE